MIKQNILSNSLTLFKFYVNDALRGFLDRPIFKNKTIRVGMILITIALYFWYFYINIRAFFGLGEIKNLPEVVSLTKITIASYIDMFIILGIYLGAFINSTLNFSNVILFTTNLLPFTKREITIGQKLFKLSFALIIFELLLVIVFPFFIRVAVLSLLSLSLLFIILHQVFIVSFLLVDIIYSVVLNILLERFRNLRTVFQYILDMLLVSIATIYMLVYRFPIENKLGYTDFSVDSIIYLIYILTLVLLVIIFMLILKKDFYTPMQVKRRFFLYRVSSLKIPIIYSLFALTRQKNFLYTIMTFILIVYITGIQNGITDALKVFASFYFLINISGINYASATSNFRKFYDFYRISIIYEGVSLVISSVILSLPLLILTLCSNTSWDNLLINYSFFLISVIFGFLFPKSNARKYPNGFLFDSGANGLFCYDKSKENYILGLLNTKAINWILQLINPTINYGAGTIRKIPVVYNEDFKTKIDEIVNILYSGAHHNWDNYETSWDFKSHPLI